MHNIGWFQQKRVWNGSLLKRMYSVHWFTLLELIMSWFAFIHRWVLMVSSVFCLDYFKAFHVPIHSDTQVWKFPFLLRACWCFSVHEDVFFIIANSGDPDEMLMCISSGSPLFAKVPAYWYPELKALYNQSVSPLQWIQYAPTHEMLVLITYAQNPPLSAHADVSRGARVCFWSEPSSTSINVCMREAMTLVRLRVCRQVAAHPYDKYPSLVYVLAFSMCAWKVKGLARLRGHTQTNLRVYW